MKLGILGTGKIVQELMQVYDRLEVEETYLLTTEKSRMKGELLAQKHGFSGVFTDYLQLLNSPIDTVYIALPNHLHYSYAKAALEHGKDVILEKPATDNLRQLEELLTMARERGRILIEAVTVHQLPAFEKLKEAVAAMGKPRLAVLNYSQYSSRYDDFKRGVIHPVFDPEKAGGALYDLNMYNLHAALGLFGKPKSIRYRANVEKGIDLSGILTLDYDDLQVVCLGAKDCQGENVSVLQSEAGVIRISEPMSRMTAFQVLPRNGSPETVDCGAENRMYTEFKSLLALMKDPKKEKLAYLQQLSLDAMAIMEEARHQVGIKFPGDVLSGFWKSGVDFGDFSYYNNG